MNCCINCFKDSHIRAIIEKQNTIGSCDFCGEKNVYIYDVNINPNPIADKLIDLLGIYALSEEQGDELLKDALHDDWDIFNGSAELILALVKALCASAYYDTDDIFKKEVNIPHILDDNFLQEYGVVRGKSWREFSDAIKYKNRFHHSEMFNPDAFESFLTFISKKVNEGERMFRARISPDKDGFSSDKMGAPPLDKRYAGRINPEGISVLYLSSNKETAISEIRALAYDFVSIGTFCLKHDIKIVNLSGIANTSPFLYADNLEQYAANRNVFQEMALEIAKPLRRSDSPLDYLPTQYISEFIKFAGYAGVEYASTLNVGGYNLAVFDESLFECTDVSVVEVKSVSYETDLAEHGVAEN